MAKTTLTDSQKEQLRETLHVAALGALMQSRRWRGNELIFQGGTGLHLAHGSPRYSEDLDFLVAAEIELRAVSSDVQRALSGSPWLPAGTSVSVSTPKPHKNPHTFNVTVSGPNIIGSVTAKIELWQTHRDAMSTTAHKLRPVVLRDGPAAGLRAAVPTAELHEIFADKVFALGARPYLKPRDIHDLKWIEDQGLFELDPKALWTRLQTYPNESAQGWIDKAAARRQVVATSQDQVHHDLEHWFPAGQAPTREEVQAMVESSVRALDLGIERMRELIKQWESFASQEEGAAPAQLMRDPTHDHARPGSSR